MCECNVGERVMLATYLPVYLTGSCIIEGSMPLLLATSLDKSIYTVLLWTSFPQCFLILTATYTCDSKQSMRPKVMHVQLLRRTDRDV